MFGECRRFVVRFRFVTAFSDHHRVLDRVCDAMSKRCLIPPRLVWCEARFGLISKRWTESGWLSSVELFVEDVRIAPSEKRTPYCVCFICLFCVIRWCEIWKSNCHYIAVRPSCFNFVLSETNCRIYGSRLPFPTNGVCPTHYFTKNREE